MLAMDYLFKMHRAISGYLDPRRRLKQTTILPPGSGVDGTGAVGGAVPDQRTVSFHNHTVWFVCEVER